MPVPTVPSFFLMCFFFFLLVDHANHKSAAFKSDTISAFGTCSLSEFLAIKVNKDNVKLRLFSFLSISILVLWSAGRSSVLQVTVQVCCCSSLCFLFPITATHSASNLVQAAPAYQIPPTLIESDCRGPPPRPPLSPQGLCKCVRAQKLRVYGRALERLGGISL